METKKNFYSMLGFSIILLMGCNSLLTTQDPSIRETQIELNVQQSLAALQLTEEEIPPNSNATLEARSVRETNAALETSIKINQEQVEMTQLALPETETTASELQATSQPELGENFDTWLLGANILLYEDMINNPNTNRYVKDTLSGMGIECNLDGDLPCKDVGSAQGWFRDDIEKGSLNGEPWDLVIISAENKTGGNERKSSLPSDFYSIVLGLVDQGIPVILETGNLDETYVTAAREFLGRCGIEFESNWIKVPTSRMVMFPQEESHPILQEPNPNLSFSDVSSFWTTKSKDFYYDIGDLFKLSPGSQSQLLVGTVPTEPKTHGTLAVCLEGWLIFQTFSSHQLSFDTMKMVWENYIFNQLKLRFLSTQ